MKVLALDLGTKCGWALADGIIIAAGTWRLQDERQRRFEGGGMKWLRLRRLLDEIGRVDRVAIEEVRRHLGTDAAHAYGGALAVVTAWCEEHRIPYEAVPVATIKKHATGRGNADKTAMLAAAAARWPDFAGDDNEADARWLLSLVVGRESLAAATRAGFPPARAS